MLPDSSHASKCAAFLDRVLDQPRYGFLRNGVFYKPTSKEIFAEFFSRLNLFSSKKNWLPVFSWSATLLLAVPFFIFMFNYFSWPLFFIGLVYSMVALGTHGTIWLHRYSTHRAYRFKNAFFRTLCRNLTIRVIPEEIYVVSHHVHHRISDQPGDPYNAQGGFLYCFLADVTHQTINKNLSEADYDRLCRVMSHTGVKLNSFAQYQKWGSLCHPFFSVGHYALNWAAWYGIFFLIGGTPLAMAIFGMSAVWAFGVRTFNYDGHGGGKDKRRDGIDFNRDDRSINQTWPGFVAGEWHNNHHLYPNSARSGFLPGQFDLAWEFISLWSKLGWTTGIRDQKEEFLRDYYEPSRATILIDEDDLLPEAL
jgi:fatty-acid desaturase